MIIRGRPSLLQVIFTVRGSVLERIWPQMCLMVAVSIAVVFAHKQFPEWVPVFNGAPFSLLGVALSIFLGFRNSACYDRWWEARKHWGQLVASARDLARQTLLWDEMGGEAAAERRTMLHLAAAHAYALADHLRPNAACGAMDTLVPDDLREGLAASDNKPHFLIMAMGRVIARLRARQVLTDMEYDVVNETLILMNGVAAACERLRNTPVRSAIRCFFCARPMSFVSWCPSVLPKCWAGRRRLPPPSLPIRSSGSTRSATNSKSPSAICRMICRSALWLSPSTSRSANQSARPTCHNDRSRSATCFCEDAADLGLLPYA